MTNLNTYIEDALANEPFVDIKDYELINSFLDNEFNTETKGDEMFAKHSGKGIQDVFLVAVEKEFEGTPTKRTQAMTAFYNHDMVMLDVMAAKFLQYKGFEDINSSFLSSFTKIVKEVGGDYNVGSLAENLSAIYSETLDILHMDEKHITTKNGSRKDIER